MKRSGFVCALILIMALPCAAQPKPAAKPPPPPPVIQATVNGSPISEAHVNRAIHDHWATPILRQIIEDRLVRQEARRLGIKMAPEAVAELFKAERAKFPSEEAFQRHLHAQGYNTAGYTEKLTTDALLAELMARLTAVSDAEIKAYYDDHQSDFLSPAEAHVYLIQTATIEEAYLAKERLALGDKFEVVAREMSKHPSANKGGDLGWVTAAGLPDRVVAEAIMGLRPSEVSNPLRAGDRFYIAVVRELKPARAVSLQETTLAITVRLKEGRAVSRQDYLDYLARRADIGVAWAPAKALAAEYAALRVIGVVVDGKSLPLAQAPVKLPNGNIIVAAKPLLQAIGAALTWEAHTSTLIADVGVGKVRLTVGSPRAIVGVDIPQARDMKQAPELREGTLFIAPRVALEALGATVEWDGIRNRLVIMSASGGMPSPTTTPAQPGGLERQ
jgi:parvulin-like peptidyl-prolyl isomerase